MPDGKTPSTWEDDKLERKPYADFLTKYLASQKEPFVINLNAEWGQGKTFFLTLWAQDVAEMHPTISINAWETDYSGDPLVAFIYAFEQQIMEQLPPKYREHDEVKGFAKKAGHLFKVAAPAILKGFVNKQIGEQAGKEIGEAIGDLSKKLIESHGQQKDAIADFKSALGLLLEMAFKEKATPMFVFIDEMDRCRPSYAVEMLENIKHFFNVQGLVFVVATDTSQLVHSVKALYGAGFDAHAYIRRFFDREYALPEPDYEHYAKVLTERFSFGEEAEIYTFLPKYGSTYETTEAIRGFFTLFAEYFKLSLRDQEQCFAKFDAICTESHSQPLFFPYLIFLIILHFKRPNLFSSFLMGVKDALTALEKEYDHNAKRTVLLWENYTASVFKYEFFLLSNKDIGGLTKELDDGDPQTMHYSLVSGMCDAKKAGGSYRDKVLLVGGLT